MSNNDREILIKQGYWFLGFLYSALGLTIAYTIYKGF